MIEYRYIISGCKLLHLFVSVIFNMVCWLLALQRFKESGSENILLYLEACIIPFLFTELKIIEKVEGISYRFWSVLISNLVTFLLFKWGSLSETIVMITTFNNFFLLNTWVLLSPIQETMRNFLYDVELRNLKFY